MRDMGDDGSNFYIQLEEEMDKIIRMADNFNERALTARQTISAKSKKGVKSPKRNVLLVRKAKQKKAQPSCKAKVPLLLHKRPRLSPLAARAALAAAVTPLRQARQAIIFKESQKLKSNVELIIDIPVYGDFLLENAMDFTIDIPVFEI